MFKDGQRNLHFVHVNKKVKGRTCRACHEVHASKHPDHTSDTVPFGAGGWEYKLNFEKTATGGQCLPGCHERKEYVRAPAKDRCRPPGDHARSRGQTEGGESLGAPDPQKESPQ